MSAAGVSPLDRLLAELEPAVALLSAAPVTAERLRVLIDRSELRAWRIERDGSAAGAPGPLAGCCPLGAGPVLIASRRPLPAGVVAGAYVVSRSLPVGPGRWVLLGRIAVVAPGRAGRFEQVLQSLRAPRGEFWRVHGGVVAQAARAA